MFGEIKSPREEVEVPDEDHSFSRRKSPACSSKSLSLLVGENSCPRRLCSAVRCFIIKKRSNIFVSCRPIQLQTRSLHGETADPI